MPLLQVRECPENLYAALGERARLEHRSIAQQTIAILEKELLGDIQTSIESRQKALNEARANHFSLPQDAPDPTDLIREDRDR